MTDLVRYPHFEGIFYPLEEAELRSMIREEVSKWSTKNSGSTEPPKGLLVPHGAYEYCGDLLGLAFAQLVDLPAPDRVIILAPELTNGKPGIKLPVSATFRSPLGQSKVDKDFCESLATSSMSIVFDETAHLQEYSIEILLPFLHYLYPETSIVPLLIHYDSSMGIPKTLSSALSIANREIGGRNLLIGVSNTSSPGERDLTETLGQKIQGLVMNYDGSIPSFRSEEAGLLPYGLRNWLSVIDFVRSSGNPRLTPLGSKTSRPIEKNRVVQYSVFRVD